MSGECTQYVPLVPGGGRKAGKKEKSGGDGKSSLGQPSIAKEEKETIRKERELKLDQLRRGKISLERICRQKGFLQGKIQSKADHRVSKVNGSVSKRVGLGGKETQIT